nr:MAG TPA: hypothetical protein [Caudoviricetes sp.]
MQLTGLFLSRMVLFGKGFLFFGLGCLCMALAYGFIKTVNK